MEVTPRLSPLEQRSTATEQVVSDILGLLAASMSGTGAVPRSALTAAALELHEVNRDLWAQEDVVRQPGITDAQVAATKRVIDRLNLRRHRLTEDIDQNVAAAAPPSQADDLHTETIGMIVDRISVLTLREQAVRARHAEDPSPALAARLESVRSQRADLRQATELVLHRWAAGSCRFQVYRANKMYGR